MGQRVTVYVDDELYERMVRDHPDLNRSAVFQAGLRSIEKCEHRELRCRCCGDALTSDTVAGGAMAELYRLVMQRLWERSNQQGYPGAARVVRAIAIDLGVPGVIATPLPVSSRAGREREAERAAEREPATVTELPTEADSRSNHPTAKARTA